MKPLIVAIAVTASISLAAPTIPSLALVPMPAHVAMGTSVFTLTPTTAIYADRPARNLGIMLQSYLSPATGFPLPVTNKLLPGCIALDQVYSFEPVPPELATNEAAHVLGAQGTLWTKWIQSPAHAEHMT